MTETIVYIAHPDSGSSSSQQFLQSSGQALSQATFVDLQAEYDIDQSFSVEEEQARLLNYDRIILQFPLYWYQAPAILKVWIDRVFEESRINNNFVDKMTGKELGLVVVAGVKEEHFQVGGREGVTISDLLSPYQALANYFQMTYLMPFKLHQFDTLTEEDKMKVIYRYGCYLEKGQYRSRLVYQNYLIAKLNELDDERLDLDEINQIIFDSWQDELESQAEELNELYRLTDRW